MSMAVCKVHDFSAVEIKNVRRKLLQWFDENQRVLPWRQMEAHGRESHVDDADVKGYRIWVSEAMLQQTQVATVINYYNTWIQKWPTLQSLAAANLEEVNQVWAGLGYYSRARRLHEGAKSIVEHMNGKMPRTAKELLTIPGIGRYTAAAIASIAYGEPVGVVDGNVVRVLSRLRAIGKDAHSSAVVDKLWNLSDSLVSPEKPGDFNQGLMELGAVLCTPRNPDCTKCPLKEECLAFRQVNNHKKGNRDRLQRVKQKAKGSLKEAQETDILDVEDSDQCLFCLPKKDFNPELGVCCYPVKAAKKPPRKENVAVVIIQCQSQQGQKPCFALVQRPKNGLLAGLWEFPSLPMDDQLSVMQQEEEIQKWLKQDFGLDCKTNKTSKLQKLGNVVHLFSHIHATYHVHHTVVPNLHSLTRNKKAPPLQWLTESEFHSAAVPTAMKKVFALINNDTASQGAPKRKRLRKNESCDRKSSSKTITAYFSKKA